MRKHFGCVTTVSTLVFQERVVRFLHFHFVLYASKMVLDIS